MKKKQRNTLRSNLLLLLILGHPAWSGGGAVAAGPYRLSAGTGITLAGLSAGCGIAALALGARKDPLTRPEVGLLLREEVMPFDRGATWNLSRTSDHLSTGLEITLLAAPLALAFGDELRADAGTLAVMYLETVVLATAVPQALKAVVHRSRPFVYNPDASIEEKLESDARRSFPSAHAAYAFSSAVFLGVVFSDYYPESPLRLWVWAAGLGTAGIVGWLRVEAGRHYPTDVLAGALVGGVLGWVVPALHRTGDGSWSLLPAASPRGTGFSFLFRLD